MNKKENDDFIYQGFYFKNEIKKYFYPGDKFLMHKKGMSIEELKAFAIDMIGDKNAFMPTLVQTMEDLLGKDNIIYDFWEFGDDDFSLYWSIKKEIYDEKMRCVREWIKYEELEDLVWVPEATELDRETKLNGNVSD